MADAEIKSGKESSTTKAKTNRPWPRLKDKKGKHSVDAQREAGLADYLAAIQSDALIAEPMRVRAQNLWEQLKGVAGPSLRVPGAMPGPDGELLLAWGDDEHHFEAELIPGGPTEFFYANEKTKEVWSSEVDAGGPLDSETIRILRLFTGR